MNNDSNFDNSLYWGDLKACLSCGEEIPEIANFCPFCGKACKKEKAAGENKNVYIAIAAVVIFFILVIIFSRNSGEGQKKYDKDDLKSSDESVIAQDESEEGISEMLSWDMQDGSENDGYVNQSDEDTEFIEPPAVDDQEDSDYSGENEDTWVTEQFSVDDQDYSDDREKDDGKPEVSIPSFEEACMVVCTKELGEDDITTIKQTAPDDLPETPIQMAINYLYAMHGYHFHTDAIREYFTSTEWYKDRGRTIEQCEAEMDKVEKANLDKLIELRKK